MALAGGAPGEGLTGLPPSSLSSFQVLEEIHRSPTGAVYRAVHKLSKTRVVLKEKRASELGPGHHADHEARLLQGLQHPNIIRCFGGFQEPRRKSFFLVLEDGTGGDLQTVVRRRGRAGRHFSELELLELFVGICRGVEYLHDRSIIHRDLKALNIVLDSNGAPKVCDLGVARLCSEDTLFLQSFHGTPVYLSPELVDRAPYTEKTDVWSLGVLLYQLAALRLPFDGQSLGDILGQIRQAAYAPLPARYSRHLGKLVRAMLHRTDGSRPSISVRPRPAGAPRDVRV